MKCATGSSADASITSNRATDAVYNRYSSVRKERELILAIFRRAAPRLLLSLIIVLRIPRLTHSTRAPGGAKPAPPASPSKVKFNSLSSNPHDSHTGHPRSDSPPPREAGKAAQGPPCGIRCVSSFYKRDRGSVGVRCAPPKRVHSCATVCTKPAARPAGLPVSFVGRRGLWRGLGQGQDGAEGIVMP